MYCRWWTPGSIILLKDRAKNGSDHSLLEILGANLGQREILPNLANSMAHNFPPFFSIKRLFIQHWPSKPSPNAWGSRRDQQHQFLQTSSVHDEKEATSPTLLVSIHTSRHTVLAMFGRLRRWWSWWWYAFKEPLAQFLDVCDTRNWIDLGALGRSELFHVQTEDDFFTMETSPAPGTPDVSILMPFAQDARVDLFGSQVS